MRPFAIPARPATRPLRLAGLAACLGTALLLSACGGGSGTSGVTSGGTPAGAVRISGAAVKGPVAGATVCAYPLTAGAKAAAGTCATTGSDGSYDLTVPVSADILLEATGGTYLDEATQVQAGLPADRPLSSVVPGNTGVVTAYLTPLTTLATNAARSASGLSASSFRQQAAALKTAFGLDAALDLSADRPDVGATPNAYGRALIAISRLAASGLSLRDLLGAADPAAYAAAFLQAHAAVGSPAGTPGTPTGPTVPTTPSVPTNPTIPSNPATPGAPAAAPQASGTLAVTAGPVPSFTPDAAGFTVSLDKADTTYRFEKQVTYPYGSSGLMATATAYVSVTRRSVGEGGPLGTTIVTASLAPELGLSGLKVKSCPGDCGIAITAPAGASRPVTLAFQQFDLGGWLLDGSLTGDAEGAAYAFADLPRTTTGSVSVNATASTVTTGDVVRGTGPGGTSRQVTLRLQNGGMVTVAEAFGPTGTPFGNRTVGYLTPASTLNLCITGCGFTVTEDAASLTITFSATTLDSGVVLDGSATLLKTSGTVTSPTLGSFTPVSDSISAANDSRTLTYSVLGTSAQGGISLVLVRHRAGRVDEVSVSTGIGVGIYKCFLEAASFIGVPACQGVTVSADGRSVTFADTAVGGGTGANRQTATLQGTLTARAF